MNNDLHTLLSANSDPLLPGFCAVEDALQKISQDGGQARGAVFTRREVVEFILNLVGYTVDQPLYQRSILEPSFGKGDFLLVAVERLFESWKRHNRPVSVLNFASCVRAVELHHDTFKSTRNKLINQLKTEGVSDIDINTLTNQWLVHGDFLLSELPAEFEFVVGNPPYVRQELIPDILIAKYRSIYTTIFDRSDLYIPFIERSVRQISSKGKVGIICANRWTKNRYGGPLRQLLSEKYHLHIYVDMVDTDAFHSEVIAYPSVFIIGRGKGKSTRVARQPEINHRALFSLAVQLSSRKKPSPRGPIAELPDIANGAQPWILEPFDKLSLVRRLERSFPCIEETGCKVGIGVATGADKAFIGQYNNLDVEDDRKLPLATTRDISSGRVQWLGLGIINPFTDKGGLVDLTKYPRLKRYLEQRRNEISRRHVARKTPTSWYRTVDRIYPKLAKTPKLLIPDIMGEARIVYEEGYLYPHHNLYYITSNDWDLRALRAVLISGIAKLFIGIYSTRMRGGYLRFQAQYLRRIRLPDWSSIPRDMVTDLINISKTGDVSACNQVVFDLYNLDATERAILSNNDANH